MAYCRSRQNKVEIASSEASAPHWVYLTSRRPHVERPEIDASRITATPSGFAFGADTGRIACNCDPTRDRLALAQHDARFWQNMYEITDRRADRCIQARAIRREGELLEEVVAAKTGPKPKNSGAAPLPNSGRFAAAERAGLSRDQAKRALRVAKIPEAEFEEAIESENPPTVTELAERGTKRKPLVDLGDRTPEQFQAATWLIGAVERLERYIQNEIDLDLAIPGLSDRERKSLIDSGLFVRLWLDKLMERLDTNPAASADSR
jgi:hypothetical protein